LYKIIDHDGMVLEPGKAAGLEGKAPEVIVGKKGF
jgi:hypothetical protein